MTRRVIPLRERDWPYDKEVPPLFVPGPLEDLERLVRGLSEGDTDVVIEGRRRLQRSMVAELQRLVGEFVIEVEQAETLREKVGRALAIGRKIQESRPPEHYVSQCVDPEGFAQLCRKAAGALVRYAAVQINNARLAMDQPPLDLAMAEDYVRLAAGKLHDALEVSSTDRIQRISELAVSVTSALESRLHAVRADSPHVASEDAERRDPPSS